MLPGWEDRRRWSRKGALKGDGRSSLGAGRSPELRFPGCGAATSAGR